MRMWTERLPKATSAVVTTTSNSAINLRPPESAQITIHRTWAAPRWRGPRRWSSGSHRKCHRTGNFIRTLFDRRIPLNSTTHRGLYFDETWGQQFPVWVSHRQPKPCLMDLFLANRGWRPNSNGEWMRAHLCYRLEVLPRRTGEIVQLSAAAEFSGLFL
jgi:hypothetical protein